MSNKQATEQPSLFHVTNCHSSDCGPPPSIDGDTPHRRYSYFQNEHGEQAIFEYNMDTKTSTLWMGDAGWDEPYTVIDGRVPELVLTPAETLWLAACWYAATEKLPKHAEQDRLQAVTARPTIKSVKDLYEELMQMSGENCYTLTADNEAEMHVDKNGATIIYPTGNTLDLPRHMIEKAISELLKKGLLTVDDVHTGITNRSGARTDRLMAVLRKLPGVTYDRRPRVLYYSKHHTT